VEAKGTGALFLYLFVAKKETVIVSFRWDTKIVTADRTRPFSIVLEKPAFNATRNSRKKPKKMLK